jgi:chromosome segregation ATPase
VLPARGRDHAGCLSDQVKLTHALNKELDQAMKDIHQFGDQGEEAGQRIIELESLYKQHEEAITKLKQENTSLELGIQSCDELILEIATEMGLDRTGEDNNEEDSEDKDDDDDGGDAATAPAAAPPATATPEMVVEDEEDPDMTILEQEVLKALEIILSDEEPELP